MSAGIENNPMITNNQSKQRSVRVPTLAWDIQLKFVVTQTLYSPTAKTPGVPHVVIAEVVLEHLAVECITSFYERGEPEVSYK